ncbi:2'-5' RNA ligase family protein [Dyadobacter sp. CY326]|uniref:2'-5' RNA ligase family protein n=1 Tax=Dyadobacter sp. CY326 TaxID=2907300 RepID=UPI001F38DAA9|nr:2'-5' RNA ligase family protein [Dyadobacter sp. CY326]MCE7066993.1 2'-5' RNA ligase family protein [Dyadobacter sp. CY326]
MERTHASTEEPTKKPLVATFVISESAQNYFNALRKQHFPPERNYLDAHLTIFHALPDEPWIVEDMQALVETQQPFEANVQSIQSLGGGTAFKIVSPELPILHQKLQKKWFDFLTKQDQQKRNFHITVQNKVESPVAKQLQAELAKDFEPFSFTVYGIKLWRYHNGPWEFLMKLDFAGQSAANK